MWPMNKISSEQMLGTNVITDMNFYLGMKFTSSLNLKNLNGFENTKTVKTLCSSNNNLESKLYYLYSK